MIPYKKNLKELSKDLRRNQTEAELTLWSRLRSRHLGYIFYRQRPLGDYIADFYCPKARLVVEVDGGQHLKPEAFSNDKLRDTYMESLGLRVLRFSNTDVLNDTDNVATSIYKYLNKIPLSPPFRKGDKRNSAK